MKVHLVQSARKDYPEHGIQKGESYFWWEFRNGGKQFSKTYPKPEQLTQSEFLRKYYGLQNDINEQYFKDFDSIESDLSDIKGTVEEMREECEEKLDNMPEHLRESSPAGERLTERIENLSNWESDLDNIELPDDDAMEEARAEEEGAGGEFNEEEWKKSQLERVRNEVLEADPGLS